MWTIWSNVPRGTTLETYYVIACGSVRGGVREPAGFGRKTTPRVAFERWVVGAAVTVISPLLTMVSYCQSSFTAQYVFATA
jgi:hypothetical protein